MVAAIQHGAPVSALLVRALERCEPRDDTRLSRVMVDLLGAVPAEGELWVSATIERGGKQIELVSAEMLGQGPDGEPASGRQGQRLADADARHRGAGVVARPAAAPASEGRNRNLADKWDRNYVHSLDWRWLTKPLAPARGSRGCGRWSISSRARTMTPLERLFAVADCANGIGTKIDISKWTFLNTDLVVHVHRIPEGEWIGIRAETNYGPDGVGTTIGTLFDDEVRSGPFSSRCWSAAASVTPGPRQSNSTAGFR